MFIAPFPEQDISRLKDAYYDAWFLGKTSGDDYFGRNERALGQIYLILTNILIDTFSVTQTRSRVVWTIFVLKNEVGVRDEQCPPVKFNNFFCKEAEIFLLLIHKCDGGQFMQIFCCAVIKLHYSDVIMSATASQISSLTIVYLTVHSGADQRKHQSSVKLAFVRGIHRWPFK